MLDLLAVRRAAEGDLVASLAGRLSERDLAVLEDLAQRMEWRAGRGEVFPTEDGEFHRRLLAHSGNLVALALVDLYMGVVQEMYEHGLPRPDGEELPRSAEAHGEIVAALRRGDGPAGGGSCAPTTASLRAGLAPGRRSTKSTRHRPPPWRCAPPCRRRCSAWTGMNGAGRGERVKGEAPVGGRRRAPVYPDRSAQEADRNAAGGRTAPGRDDAQPDDPKTVRTGDAAGGGDGPAPGRERSGRRRPALDLRGVTIEHWIQNALTHPEGMAKEKVMQNFSTQSGTGVSVTSTGGNNLEKVTAALTAGTPPDLVDGFHFNMSALFRQGATLDIEEALKGNADWRKLPALALPGDRQRLHLEGQALRRAPLQQLLQHVLPAGVPQASRPGGPPAEDVELGAVPGLQPKGGPPAGRAPPTTNSWSYSRTGMLVLNNGHRFHQPGRDEVLLQQPRGDRGPRVPDGP